MSKPIRQIHQTSYTLQEADNGERLAFTSALTVVVFAPPSLSLGWSVDLIQMGAGTVEVTTQAGIAISNRFNQTRSFGRYSKMTLEVVSSGQFLLTGDVATSDITT